VEELVREVDSVEKLSRGAFIDKLSLITRPKREHFLLGLPSLDQHTQGICRGEFFLFLGAPKGRKTSFLSTSAIGALVSNPEAKVMFVSFEMTLESMKERFALSMDTFSRARGYTGPSDIAEVAKFLGVDKRFYVFYAEPGSSISQLKRALDRLKSTDGFVPDVIFLDYMVFMQPQMKRSEKRHELAEIARDCVRLASQYNAGVVSAHLLKRESLEKGREITRADISESYEVIAVVDAAIAIAVEKENSGARPKYHLKIVAGRRFEDDCLVGTFSAAYDGVTMEEVTI
jgi:replicative DNA helicase